MDLAHCPRSFLDLRNFRDGDTLPKETGSSSGNHNRTARRNVGCCMFGRIMGFTAYLKVLVVSAVVSTEENEEI